MNIDLLNQEFNEKRYSRKFIDGYIRDEILANPVMVEKIQDGVARLQKWMSGTYYESKMRRIAQLQGLKLEQLVVDIFVGIAYFQKEELYTSVTAQLAGRVGFSDKVEAITTMAEMVAVLCLTDAFDILKPSKMASLMVRSCIPLSQKLLDHIEQSQYLPPMVCEPRKLTSNYCSGYLSHNDSLVLGQGNHHEGDLCIDVLNIVNAIPLQLATDLICGHEEMPTFELDTPEKKEQWHTFKKQSYRFYDLIVSQGNRFWLTNKVDKRGRMYACGYHISTQASGFKKASIELAEEELVEGVPA